MAASTVRVHGLNETLRAFSKIDLSLVREVKNEIKHAAEPVAATARSRISRYRGASIQTIQPIATQRGAFVRQRQNKRTGNRPFFGSLQMRHLLGALEENEDEIVRGVEKALDNLTREAGF